MPNDFELDQWIEAQEYQVQLNAEGEIVDFLDPEITRPNKPEERIRQRMGQIIHAELGYPKEVMAFERTINIGVEKKRAGSRSKGERAGMRASDLEKSIAARTLIRAPVLSEVPRGHRACRAPPMSQGSVVLESRAAVESRTWRQR